MLSCDHDEVDEVEVERSIASPSSMLILAGGLDYTSWYECYLFCEERMRQLGVSLGEKSCCGLFELGSWRKRRRKGREGAHRGIC